MTSKSIYSENSVVLVTGGSGFIGSHLIELLHTINPSLEIHNLDIAAPTVSLEIQKWHYCNINSYSSLEEAVINIKPDFLIHLAADVYMNGSSLLDYPTNIQGVRNIVEICQILGPELRVIFASTQHVRCPGSPAYLSSHSYYPLAMYGKSKVEGEQIVLNADLLCTWTIIRPTLVWGPRNMLMANGFLRHIYAKQYIHPSNDNVVRSYGFVLNVCHQIIGLLAKPRLDVANKTFYVSDHNILQKEWITLMTLALGADSVKYLPRSFFYVLAKIGDFLSLLKIVFPMYTQRYMNLTTSNPVPLEGTISLLGAPVYDVIESMDITAEWLKKYYQSQG